MTFEQLLGETLHAADAYEPSPDLFAKVQRSITEDQAHRRWLRSVAIGVAAAIGAIVVYLAFTADGSTMRS